MASGGSLVLLKILLAAQSPETTMNFPGIRQCRGGFSSLLVEAKRAMVGSRPGNFVDSLDPRP